MSSHAPPANMSAVINGINRELKQRGHLSESNENEGREEEVIADNREYMTGCAGKRRHMGTHLLANELRAQNFDIIRFATYRTACKLRFIQKRTNLYLVDIWNMIEAFRENNLTSMEGQTEVPTSVLQKVLTTIFRTLNKRLPNSAQISVEESVDLLYSLLCYTYDRNAFGVLRVLSIKASLAILCAGKFLDKLKYAFSLVSNANGNMSPARFDDYLREILTLPSAVFEGPSFEFNDGASRACFDRPNEVTVDEFLDTMLAEPGPECLMWLSILHKLATVENVFHPVQCEACRRESFSGFRYKCQRCYNYHLCQDCFWTGRATGNHSNDHEVKEYSFYKSPVKQLEHSLKKSIRCVPTRTPSVRSTGSSTGSTGGGGMGSVGGGSTRSSRHGIDSSDRIVHHVEAVDTMSPRPLRNGSNRGDGRAVEQGRSPGRTTSLDRAAFLSTGSHRYLSNNQSPSHTASHSLGRMNASDDSHNGDDEHRLIARYTARLAADLNNGGRSPSELGYSHDANRAQRELVAQLEKKNRDIMREIHRLRCEQDLQTQTVLDRSANAMQQRNPVLLTELKLLRQRRDELEGRMAALQDSRNDLMIQLEGLMALLQTSEVPRSGYDSSRRFASMSNNSPLPAPRGRRSGAGTGVDSLTATGDHIMRAFTGPQSGSDCLNNMRDHLFVAADSVTDAMSSLVKELNSEVSSASEEDEESLKRAGFKQGVNDMNADEFHRWQQQMQHDKLQERQFLEELNRHRILSSGGGGAGRNISGNEASLGRTDLEHNEMYDRNHWELSQNRYMRGGGAGRVGREEESCLETDQESYIRTDDEEGGNTDWEDASKRWLNR